MVLDSFDGTEHHQSSGIKASVTSHNSQIFSKSMQLSSTAESFNILTWQQILADEKLENIIPAVDSTFEEKLEYPQKEAFLREYISLHV